MKSSITESAAALLVTTPLMAFVDNATGTKSMTKDLVSADFPVMSNPSTT